MRIPRPAHLLLVVFAFSTRPVTAMTVHTDFPGGSAVVRELDAAGQMVRIEPATQFERGWPCWWYLRLDGLVRDRPVTVKISASTKPYRAAAILTANWAQPRQAAISTDNVTWAQTPPGEISKDRVATYRFAATAERMWIAWGPPFVPATAEEVLAQVAARCPEADRFELAKTRGGRPVNGIRLGGGTPEAPAPFGVWVQARQHAWESGGSWVGRGFIEWAAGGDAEAVEFRRMATIHYVPIMDVDNAALGAGGKDAVPRDHNRDWSDQPVYPEVAAAQARLRALDAAGRLHVFLDLHNPGPSESRPYFFGPFDLPNLDAQRRRNYLEWLAIAAASINGPLALDPKYHFATYVKTEEERNRMSGTWVRNYSGPHAIAMTLETVWNTPHSTTGGYRTVGRQLGQALVRYLKADPRRMVVTNNQ